MDEMLTIFVIHLVGGAVGVVQADTIQDVKTWAYMVFDKDRIEAIHIATNEEIIGWMYATKAVDIPTIERVVA